MCGVFVRIREVVDQALSIFGLESDDPRELSFVMRVILIEALGDELRMVVILGEDDRLSEPVAACHLLPAGHQVFEHLVHCIRVEQPPIDCRRFHAVRERRRPRPIPARPTAPFPPLTSSSYVIPSRWNLSGTETAFGGTRKPSAHRVIQSVSVSRHAIFKIEQPIGVSVDFVLRRGRQPDQQRIEVLEDRAVLLINRPVRLIDDDQIEVADAEASLAILRPSMSPIIVG